MWFTSTVALASSLALAAPAEVALTAADGTALHAVADIPAGVKTGAVLVHMANRSQSDWQFVAEKLARGGMEGPVDLRGHGKSACRRAMVEADYLVDKTSKPPSAGSAHRGFLP